MADDEDYEDEDDSWLDEIALFIGFATGLQRSKGQSPEAVYAGVQTSVQEQLLYDIFHFLTTLQLPTLPNEQAKRRFIQKASRYFVQQGAMFKRNQFKAPIKVIFAQDRRQHILEQAHEQLGHRGEQAVMQTCKARFFWPSMWSDIQHHVRSCHQCQIRSVKKVEVPIMVSTPTTIFLKIHVDIMYMPKVRSF